MRNRMSELHNSSQEFRVSGIFVEYLIIDWLHVKASTNVVNVEYTLV